MFSQNLLHRTQYDIQTEELIVRAVRHELLGEGRKKRNLRFLPGYVRESISKLTDNALWAITNDIDTAEDLESDDEEWLSLRDDILEEQKNRCKKHDESVREYFEEKACTVETILGEVDEAAEYLDEAPLHQSDFLEAISYFRSMPKKEQRRQFKEAEKPLTEHLLSGDVLNLPPEPFVAAISATVETFATKNGFDSEDLFVFLSSYAAEHTK